MPPIFRQPGMPYQFPRMMHVQQFGFGSGPGFGLFQMLFFLVLAAAAILVISALVRGRGGWANAHGAVASATTTDRDPLKILDERFARGEVDVDDYKMRRELLASHA